ncbi:ASCH domain-containing protein [Enterococcus plantarum]|uniref:ASCH domain-containing protein n=2 Tax=Enterococcus plantarum TaxID=1077675 RepID=UPI001A8ED8B3|nr:ASCH domain-containing protein [Enterococcus plantarum]MBO0421295.1 ASCH domain-containing protein [Enterococcus plantarum]
MNQSVVALWTQFKNQYGITHDEYQAWAFGNSSKMADELLAHVLRKEKTGTSSLHLLYEQGFEGEKLPEVGDYSVLLDGNDQAQAIICTRVVDILPYSQISEVHGYLEGEGDRTLQYWRNVHQPFFEQELQVYGLPFSEDMLIVYELFELVFQNSAQKKR